MSYHLGIDLGTTYTAAAVNRDGTVSIVNLGNRAPVVPSVVLLRDDEEVLTGEAAARRAVTEPQRVAREFKRRIGDPTPIIVGGVPYSADALMAKLLRWVVDKVTELEGGPPASIAISHPANWGSYKQDLLQQAIARADLDGVVTITEPEAAAIHYASQERVEPGAVVATYDLGGGTFDAAVLRKTETGWEVLGDPQGIERLGGVDFDEAVFQHVVAATDGVVTELDPDDPTALAAVARLRQECVEAKEALSSDTDVSIPVLLPNLQTEVRLTRAELEQMMRPALTDTITTMARALRSAGVEPDQVDAILLVGGSSRIPLVAQMVGAELGRPVAVDAHPKHGIALGAALVAAQRAGDSTADDAVVAAIADETVPPAEPGPLDEPVEPQAEPAPVVDIEPPPTEPVAAVPSEPTPVEPEPTRVAHAVTAPPTSSSTSSSSSDDGGRRGGLPLVPIVLGVVVVAVIAAVAVFALGDDDDKDASASEGTTPSTETTEAPPTSDDTAAPSTSEATTTTAEEVTTTTTEAVPAGPFVRVDSVTLDGGRYRVHYTVSGFEPQVDGGGGSMHLHFFLDTTAPENAGVDGNPPGVWHLTDEPDTTLTPWGPDDRRSATQMCGVVANVDHSVYDPASGTCAPLP